MLEGGRIIHYISNHGHDPNNTILFVGFQAQGTRGRDLVSGNMDIKFFGEYHTIKAKIKSIGSMSAHADKNEMSDWMSNFTKAPKAVFLNHGEPHQINSFRVNIETKFKWNVKTPQLNEAFDLE